MRVFIDVEGLSKLEQAGKWEEARILLYSMWKQDCDNMEICLRLCTECWYIMAEEDCEYNPEGISYELFQKTLIEAITYGLENFYDNHKFLWIIGYMISLFPYFFYVYKIPEPFTEWEQKGHEMLQLAHQMRPEDAMIEVLSLGWKPYTKKNSDIVKPLYIQIKPQLDDLFSDETVIETYFKNMLSIKENI